MTKIFRTTMAICLFTMAMLVMNTSKVQAQILRVAQSAYIMYVGESNLLHVDCPGWIIVDLSVTVYGIGGEVMVENIFQSPTDLEFAVLAMKSGDVIIRFEATVRSVFETKVISAEIYILILDHIIFSVNSLQPETPDSMFAIKQDDLLALA